MENKRRLMNLITLCLISLLVVLAACGVPVPPSTEPPPSEPPPPTEPSSEQPPPPEFEIDTTGYSCEEIKPIEDQTEVASNGIFIDGQLLLRGPEELVLQIGDNASLTLRRLCHLNYLSNESVVLVTALYTVPDGVDPEELSEQINKTYEEAGVTASPNYLVGPSAGSCADPYSDGGSPSGTLNPQAGREMFLTQWAPENIGLTHIPSQTGWSNVHVVVFDTMPKSIRPLIVGIAPFVNTNTFLRRIEWPNTADPIFQFKAYDTLGNKRYDPGPNGSPHEPANLSSHGFFVAGLIRLVAPNSQIHLIRVLGDNACGSFDKLRGAIDEFMGAMHGKKIVINLSLGVRHLPGSNLVFLKQMLKDLYDQSGVVIIAAAGNDSANLTTPVSAQLPAKSEFVIGAVASNSQGKRSCYSNQAAPTPTNAAPNANNLDVAAPGGDGGKKAGGPQDCVSRTMTWKSPPVPCPTANAMMQGGMPDCRYGVISLINPLRLNTTPVRWKPGYGFWSGSSFSTPLVSGLAALLFQNSSTTNTRVYCLIERGANPSTPDLGAGVIDIPRSLTLAAAGVC